MEEQFITLLSITLMAFTSYLAIESLLSRRVRTRRQDVTLFVWRPSAWFRWISRDEEPGPYWFWTAFYIAGFFLGAYLFVVL